MIAYCNYLRNLILAKVVLQVGLLHNLTKDFTFVLSLLCNSYCTQYFTLHSLTLFIRLRYLLYKFDVSGTRFLNSSSQHTHTSPCTLRPSHLPSQGSPLRKVLLRSSSQELIPSLSSLLSSAPYELSLPSSRRTADFSRTQSQQHTLLNASLAQTPVTVALLEGSFSLRGLLRLRILCQWDMKMALRAF
jgi:hypothetical protein